MFQVDRNKLAKIQKDVQQSFSISQNLLNIQARFQNIAFPVTTSDHLYQLKVAHEKLHQSLYQTMQYFDTTKAMLENLEQKLKTSSSSLASLSTSPYALGNASIKTDFLKFNHRFHTTLSANRNLMAYIKNGVCVGAFAGFDIAHFQVEKNMKYLQTGVDAKVGNVHISGDAKALLFKDGVIDPSLTLSANAEATLAQIKAYANIGNDYVNAQGEASLKVGTASAEAKAVISKDEFTLKADVGAAALKGETKGSISIFGVKITASGVGEIGSVGASAEFSSKKGSFEFGGKAALFAGLGFKIRVDYE